MADSINGDGDKKKDDENGFLPGFETSIVLIAFLIAIIYLNGRNRIKN